MSCSHAEMLSFLNSSQTLPVYLAQTSNSTLKRRFRVFHCEQPPTVRFPVHGSPPTMAPSPPIVTGELPPRPKHHRHSSTLPARTPPPADGTPSSRRRWRPLPQETPSPPPGDTVPSPRETPSPPPGRCRPLPWKTPSPQPRDTVPSPREMASPPPGDTVPSPRETPSPPPGDTIPSPRETPSPPPGRWRPLPRKTPSSSLSAPRHIQSAPGPVPTVKLLCARAQ